MTDEKVELSEQTPLKQDTDAPATEETVGGESGEQAPQQPAEKKKWWFQKNAKKENKEENSDSATKKETESSAKDPEVGDVPATKKPRWWQRKPCCTAKDEGTTFGIDFVRRDEQQLQTVIDLGFGDIFGEPDSVHSFNGVWRATHSIFTAVRNFFYKLFTVLICVPAAIVFGVLFALVSALSVFVVLPAARLLAVPANWFVKLWAFVLRGLLEPVFAAVGQLFGYVRIHRYGLNTDPTATMGV